jgi:hypothetical protein
MVVQIDIIDGFAVLVLIAFDGCEKDNGAKEHHKEEDKVEPFHIT